MWPWPQNATQPPLSGESEDHYDARQSKFASYLETYSNHGHGLVHPFDSIIPCSGGGVVQGRQDGPCSRGSSGSLMHFQHAPVYLPSRVPGPSYYELSNELYGSRVRSTSAYGYRHSGPWIGFKVRRRRTDITRFFVGLTPWALAVYNKP